MFTKESDGDLTDAIGFILAIGLIFGFLGLLGGGAVETSRKRPYLLAIALLAAVGGGYYYFSRSTEPTPVVAVVAQEASAPAKKAAFCFEAGQVKGTMVAMDDEKVVIKDGSGKLHTYRNEELNTVSCE
jgi:hypothetical protein